MEQHPVPQNVTTFQFRLIGDMTIKQFGYLAGGAMLGYILYRMPFPAFISLPAGVCIFLLGFGFAFVPVEERPMDVWFMSFIKSIYSPTLYVWQRQKPIPEPTTAGAPAKAGKPADGQKNPPAGGPAPAKPGEAPVKTTTPAAPAPFSPATPKPPSPPPHTTPPVNKTPGAVSASVPKPEDKIQPGSGEKQVPQTKPGETPADKSTPPPMAPEKKPGVVIETKPQKIGFFAWLASLFTPKAKHPPAGGPKPTVKPPPPKPIGKTGPDLFAGAPTPVITGQKINVTDKAVIEAKPTLEPQPSAPEQPKPLTAEQRATADSIAKAENKSKELEDKLAGLQNELKQQSASEARIVELQKQLTEILSERQKMQDEMTSLRNQLQKSKSGPAPAPRTAGYTTYEESKPTVKIISPESAVKAGMPKLTSFPNVVTGIIKDNEDNLLPGVLVTVRDKDDVPVRALKTNKLGQFAASTPLPGGTYFVEVEDPRGRFVFDRIQISLSGSVVPAIEVIAKSQKELSRAKLEKEIFGNQQI